jgi:hypothetical protein
MINPKKAAPKNPPPSPARPSPEPSPAQPGPEPSARDEDASSDFPDVDDIEDDGEISIDVGYELKPDPTADDDSEPAEDEAEE